MGNILIAKKWQFSMIDLWHWRKSVKIAKISKFTDSREGKIFLFVKSWYLHSSFILTSCEVVRKAFSLSASQCAFYLEIENPSISSMIRQFSSARNTDLFLYFSSGNLFSLIEHFSLMPKWNFFVLTKLKINKKFFFLPKMKKENNLSIFFGLLPKN